MAKTPKKMRHWPKQTGTSVPMVAATVEANDPVPDVNTQHRGGGSRLERLPAEIRWNVLSVLDVDCLKALVRASPTFRQQYRQDRRRLLCASLQVTLGSVSLDACMINEARHPISANTEDWRDQLPHRSSFQLVKQPVTEDKAVAMARFYLNLVAPVARHFMKEKLNALRRLDGSVGTHSDSDTKLSDTEWQRCLRAAYRFQLLCCAAKSNQPLDTREALRPVHDILESPEPWEGEELLNFYYFAERAFQDVSNDIALEADPHNRRFEHGPAIATPLGMFVPVHIAPGTIRRYCQELRELPDGLELLRTVLFDPKLDNREQIARSMQHTIVRSRTGIYIGNINNLLCREGQRLDRRERDSDGAPSRRDELTNERAPLPFQGDDLDLPPLAWTEIWDGTYSNLIGSFIPPEIRTWGYVFWDADRMNRKGRRHLLRSQWSNWTDRWDGDPRGTLDQEGDTEYQETDEETEEQEADEEDTDEEDTDEEDTDEEETDEKDMDEEETT